MRLHVLLATRPRNHTRRRKARQALFLLSHLLFELLVSFAFGVVLLYLRRGGSHGLNGGGVLSVSGVFYNLPQSTFALGAGGCYVWEYGHAAAKYISLVSLSLHFVCLRGGGGVCLSHSFLFFRGGCLCTDLGGGV